MSIAISVQEEIGDGRTDRHTDLSINYIGTRADARRVIHVAPIYIINRIEIHLPNFWFNLEQNRIIFDDFRVILVSVAYCNIVNLINYSLPH